MPTLKKTVKQFELFFPVKNSDSFVAEVYGWVYGTILSRPRDCTPQRKEVVMCSIHCYQQKNAGRFGTSKSKCEPRTQHTPALEHTDLLQTALTPVYGKDNF